MLSLKLAFRNLMGAGLRTWLNVFVLSLSFVVIIWHKGMLDGWDRQAKSDMISWECGGGQYWHSGYDPYDPFSLSESHGLIPESILKAGLSTPILISQGSIYPGGRIQSVLIKGIDPAQKILSIPSHLLETNNSEIPVLIGQYMAKANRLKQGDSFSIRWRTSDGAFDAADAVVVGVFNTSVPTVDASQVWVSLSALQSMLGLPGEATLMVLDRNTKDNPDIAGWQFIGLDILLSDVDKVIQAKSASGMVLWFILLLLAMLAIFDTQVLSIFRRQKEIGTCIALGMTKAQVIRLFTVEGALHSVFAAVVAFIWGTPLLYWQAKKGIRLPVDGSDFGLSISEVLYPEYGLTLILSTSLIVLITTTIVSYLPSRKIAKMNPTEAIRGKIK